jgi:hypothetical protein
VKASVVTGYAKTALATIATASIYNWDTRIAQHSSTVEANAASRAYYESNGHPVQELHGQHVPVEAGGKL